MIYEEKEVRLRDGTSVLLRSPQAADAAQMVDYLKTVCAETPFLTREPEEADIPLDKEEPLLQRIADSENDLMIACEINGKIVGNANLNRMTRLRMRHRASVGVAVFREYWGRGIGSLLFSELIRIAKELGIRQLELEVVGGNDRARNMYERFGFAVVGEKPNAFRLKDGTMLSEISMIKELESIS